MNKYITLTIFVFTLFSCNFFSKEKEEKPIARVHDKFLYKLDIRDIVPSDVSKEDSIFIMKNYIQDWILENLIVYEAEQNLPENRRNFKRELDNYKNSLIIYEYQKDYIELNIDTAISEEEIDNYYENNKSCFLLKNNIVKGYYIKIKKNTPQVYNLWYLYRSDDSQSRVLMESFCKKYAESYSFNDKEWMPANDFLKHFPIDIDSEENFLKYRRNIETNDSEYYYFGKIKDYKLIESISPINFVKENIKTIIYNKRKLELIEGMEKKLYNSAINLKNIQVY